MPASPPSTNAAKQRNGRRDNLRAPPHRDATTATTRAPHPIAKQSPQQRGALVPSQRDHRNDAAPPTPLRSNHRNNAEPSSHLDATIVNDARPTNLADLPASPTPCKISRDATALVTAGSAWGRYGSFCEAGCSAAAHTQCDELRAAAPEIR
jgi:hypothetical protein